MPKQKFIATNDKLIRKAFKLKLEVVYASGQKTKIIEELGILHGTARIDIAVVNGIMHGYEIKSDQDTLKRLPEQIKEYNAVFDKLTLVVGRRHLYKAIHIIPDWWGVMIAIINENNKMVFHVIREAGDNQKQVGISIARLLWKEEALQILERKNKAEGFRSKPRKLVYERLTNVIGMNTLKKQVRNTLLVTRKAWRSDA